MTRQLVNRGVKISHYFHYYYHQWKLRVQSCVMKRGHQPHNHMPCHVHNLVEEETRAHFIPQFLAIYGCYYSHDQFKFRKHPSKNSSKSRQCSLPHRPVKTHISGSVCLCWLCVKLIVATNVRIFQTAHELTFVWENGEQMIEADCTAEHFWLTVWC